MAPGPPTLGAPRRSLFGTDITTEYRLLIREMGFSPREVAELARNGFRASLLAPETVGALCAEIDATLWTLDAAAGPATPSGR